VNYMHISTRAIIVLLLVCSLLFTGCALNTPNKSPAGNSGENEKTGGQNTEYPQSVVKALEAVKPLKVGTSVIEGDKTYIIASFGQQPTAGYKAEITGVKKEGNKVTATVRLEPPQDDAAATVVTYPQAVEVLKGRYERVDFIKEGDYMPQIVGLKEPLKEPKYSSDNIMVLSYNPANAHVSGIARVFEGTINYEFRSAEGTMLAQGCITTASGAPDWGYYKLGPEEIPENTSELILYQASAKDGSMQDEIILPVEAN